MINPGGPGGGPGAAQLAVPPWDAGAAMLVVKGRQYTRSALLSAGLTEVMSSDLRLRTRGDEPRKHGGTVYEIPSSLVRRVAHGHGVAVVSV